VGRDIFTVNVDTPDKKSERPQPHVELRDMLLALTDVMRRSEMFAHHQISREPLSIRERMTQVLAKINPDTFIEFTRLFTVEEGRRGVVVTFMAILELMKQSMIEMIQAEPFGPIHVKAVGAASEGEQG